MAGLALSGSTMRQREPQPPTYYQTSAGPGLSLPALSGQHSAEVVIVGGGYAGLGTALSLAERGQRGVVVLEADEVGFGASGRNGGFVFAGFSQSEEELLRMAGPERARRLYASTQAAVRLVRTRIGRYAIDCDLVDEGVIWANWFRDEGLLRARQRLLREHYGSEWQWLSPQALQERVASPRYHAGLFEPDALHLHPLKWARGLASAARGLGVTIHEHSPVIGLRPQAGGWRLETANGARIDTPNVVLACGGYLAGLVARIDRSVLPIATYAMATEPLGERLATIFPGTRAAVYDSRFAFDYYRPLADTRLLWGGRVSILDRSPRAVARLLTADLARVFPQLGAVRIDSAWSGLMSYARHAMPELGRLEPGLWYAQAFGGHGQATTIAAGEALAAALTEGPAALADYAPFGLPWAGKPFGLLAAQLSYAWMQGRDRLKTLVERGFA